MPHSRRAFLSLIAASAGALSTRSFYDMGQAWQKHASGLIVPWGRIDRALGESGLVVRCDLNVINFVSTVVMHGDDGTEYTLNGLSGVEGWNLVGQRIRLSHFDR